jgi:hypothetical protein
VQQDMGLTQTKNLMDVYAHTLSENARWAAEMRKGYIGFGDSEVE